MTLKALQDAKSGNFDEVASSLEEVKGTVDEISKDAEISGSVESIKDTAKDIKAEADKAAAPTETKTVATAAKKTTTKKQPPNPVKNQRARLNHERAGQPD